MSFIMVWKVAGLLVIPKNITKGSNRPRLVQKGESVWCIGSPPRRSPTPFVLLETKGRPSTTWAPSPEQA